MSYTKRFAALLVLLLALACSVVAQEESDPQSFIGAAAPNFILPDLSGKEIELKSLQGKVVMLNFWATWCGWCKVEMPAMQKLQREFKEQGLVILTINYKEDADTARAFLEENNYSFMTLLDVDGLVAKQVYQTRSLPTTVVINKEGKIVAYDRGAQSERDFRAALAKAGMRTDKSKQ